MFLAKAAWLNTVSHADGLFIGATHVSTGHYARAYARLANESFMAPMATRMVYMLSNAHC
jgi:hypothetical protein